MFRPAIDYCVLLIWCAFLFGYGIGAGTLYRTEALRAIIGREAMHGAWLTPTLYGEPFLTKPPGMYAAIAAASLPFGEVTTLSARFPSVVAATLTVFLFFGAFRRIADRQLALAAAMLMPMSLLWLDKAPSAEIDMLQLLWVSAALLCFLRAVEAEESSHETFRLGWWLLSLLAVAGGFLTKWTAPAFFYVAIIPFLCWRGRLALLWSRRHLLAAAVAAGLCAAWAWAAASHAGWNNLVDTVAAEGAQRLHPHRHGKPYPWLESLSYPFVVLAANLPWSLPALWALRPAFAQRWDENGRRMLQLLHCWTWPNLLFWSLPAQHHVRYTLPICPGIVGLGVMVLIAWARDFSSRSRPGQLAENGPPSFLDADRPVRKARFSPRAALIGIVLAYSVVKIVFVEVVAPGRTAHVRVRETAARLAELVPAGEMLYLCKLKDEGILFYYNRPARHFRWNGYAELGAFYALLIESEWREWKDSRSFDVVEWLRDQQGEAVVLVRFH